MSHMVISILALIMASAVLGCETSGSDPTTPSGGSDSATTDNGLPPFQDRKEDGDACDPDADAGVDAGSPCLDGGKDATIDPSTDTEASDDATVTTDEGTPQCPPPGLPKEGEVCSRGHGCPLSWEDAPYCGATCDGYFGETRDNPLSPEEVLAFCGPGQAG